MHAFKLLLTSAALFATVGVASTSALSATVPFAGLPSCTVAPSQNRNAAPVYIGVDANGRFYSDQFFSTPSGYRSSRSYVTTDNLEALCAQGAKIAFLNFDKFSTVPSPTLFVQEYRNNDVLPNYLLVDREEDAFFILSGKAGPGWLPTSLRFRLPRVAADLVPVHLFFGSDHPGVVTHFYTANAAEYEIMMRKVNSPASANVKWVYERVAFYAPRASVSGDTVYCSSGELTPIFRFVGIIGPNTQPKYRHVANRETIASIQFSGYAVQATGFCALVD